MTSPDFTSPPPAIPPEPPAVPPASEGRRYGSIIVGLVIIAVGLWYFADRTLGLELPSLEADHLWPIAVIGLGAWLIIRPKR
ncbi:MAG: hypothetical protein WEE50_05635 [Chloroflexota bacterium]